MRGFIDYLRSAMGWWSGFESTTPDPLPGVDMRLRCTNEITFRLEAQDTSATFRLPCTNSITFRLRASGG